MPSTRYPEIEVSGAPFELGEQLGEATRDLIRSFAAIALERVNKTTRISRERAMAVAASSFEYVEAYSPDMLDELRGMARGAGVSREELMLLQIRNQLLPEDDAGCSSFSVADPATARHGGVVGQNWDNDPALDPFTVVLTRRPRGKPAQLTVTQAGLISYIGVNDRGLGVCLNTLPAPSRRLGVPHYFIVRGIHEAHSLDEAIEAVRRAERALPANLILATPQGPADLEITTDDVRVLRGRGGIVTHTNHCLHPDLLPINDKFPELIDSHARKRRLDELFGAMEQPLSVDACKAVLQDHDNYPRSICRHGNDQPPHGFWESVFSVVIEAPESCMHISRGTPCNHPFEIYRLT
jgi:isopenicillin-N N-acyltransferase-like protein